MSSETLFDVARVTLARLRAVRPASAQRGLLTTAAHSLRVVAAAAAEGDDEAEEEEQDRTFHALGQVQEICASLEERLALYDYPEASITQLEASHTNNTTHTITTAEEKCAEEEASCAQDVELCLCTTSPLLRTLAWLAHTQRPRISTLDERGSEAQGEERKTADNGAGVQRDKVDLRPDVSYTLNAQCRALWSFPDTVASAVLASSSHTNTTTLREGGREDEMYGSGGSSSSGGGAASLDSLRGFSFSSELYYARLADALWVFALTTSPTTTTTTASTTERTTQETSGGSSSISGETYEEKDGRAVVYAMLRSGVARGFSHTLQQRLTLALRSVLCHALPCEAHGCLRNILLGIMAGADVGQQRSRAAGFHLTHRKALQQTSSENESIQVRTRRWRLSASWQDWLRCLCTTAMTRSTSTSGSEGNSSDETLLPQRSWANVLHEMLVELLHSSAACSVARALAAVHISTAHEEEQDEEIARNEPSVMHLLAQRVCYGVCVELTSRQNTPRSLLRFIFHNLLRTSPPSPQRQITRRSEYVGEAALQAVFDAWASASCVQHGDLALNETLQHAVLYAMRWLVTHKDKSKEKEGEKNEEQTRPQQKQQHFPTRWLGALLSGITLRLESVRTEALRQAALCVAAAFALYFVEAAEAVQNLLQDAQYASALNDWLAEEEEEEDESKSANDERVMHRREGLKLRTSSSSPYNTHNVKSWAAGRGLPVRRVVAYSRTQRYPLDPDEPFMYFVHEQEKDEEEEGERTSPTGATRLVRDASTPTTAITAYHNNSTGQDVPGAATAAVQQTARVQDLPSFGLRRLPGEPHTIMSYVDPTLNQQNNNNNNNNSITLVGGGRTKNRKSNEEEEEDEDAILYMSDPAQQSQQHNSVPLCSLRAAYDALAGIGRSSQAQLYEVQEEQERGLRGLLWCLRRHVRQMQSVATAQQTQATSPATTFTLSELGPMLPTLLPVLMGLAFHVPEAERAQLLAYRTEALELLLVAAPTLSLAQLSTMIYNSRYGIAERVAMLDAIGHAAHRLSTLTQSAASSATHTNNNNNSNNNTMKKSANGNARVMPRRIYPPIPTHDHTHRGGTSMSAHSRAGLIRRAIVVNEGSRGQTRRWGYAVHGRQQNSNNNENRSGAHAPVLFYNAFAPHAMSFLAVLLARLDKEHYKFFQSDDPYSPAAVLRALWYILDGVRLVRHVAPRLCGEAMPFLCSAAAQHPHAAVRKFAWIMCGEAMRCWCGAVPLFAPTRGRPADKKSHTRNSTTNTSTSISNNEGEEDEEEGGLRRTPVSEAYKGYDGGHSFMFSEEWLAGFAALERVASALLGNSGADRSTCEMALLVMCDLRELVEGTREAAWLAEQNTAHAIEIV